MHVQDEVIDDYNDCKEDVEELFPLLLKIDPRELKIFAKLLNILWLNIKDFI